MKKSLLLVSILIVIIFVLASCSGAVGTMYSAVQSVQAPTSVTASMIAASGDTAAVDEESEVSIGSQSYNPATITIKAGTTVTWTNNDTNYQTIRSSEFISPVLFPGQTFQYKYDTPGTFAYSNDNNVNMTGKIIVQ